MMEEIVRQERKYSEYIENHIENVKLVWKNFERRELFPSLGGEVEKLIKIHDASKFSKEEFSSYRQFFYPVDNTEKNQEIFDKAWQHHYQNNPHHWEYWVNYSLEITPDYQMPLQYVIEMLCDWTAMSLVFGDKPSAFYDNKKEGMVLHESTKEIIDSLLPYFDQIVKETKEGAE